ncbi:MAG: mechanosensitive ion channel family protein [Gammaproteobacteria bacterium]
MTTVEALTRFALTAVLFALLFGGLMMAHHRSIAYYKEKPNQEFRRQILMLGLTMFAILLGIVMAPLGDSDLRGQLLSLYGIIVSATIALSSTTIVGNAMAGIMLRFVEGCKPGDYIHVGEHFGRISEMDLLHTEIQTEERDLTTLPNLFMVTNPIKTLRKSGTILKVDVSLGYDVPRHKIEQLLKDAAEKTGLQSPFVQIRALGDFSVSYAIAGLLTDLQQLISKRRQLRAATMDVLHEAGIEIASPTIHSLREYDKGRAFIPEKPDFVVVENDSSGPDGLVFDKANQAENLENMRSERDKSLLDLEQVATKLKEAQTDEAKKPLELEKARLERRTQWIAGQITKLENRIAADS